LKMMVRYGIDNVRGGKWCMLEFSNINRSIIESRIKALGNTDYIPKSNIKIKIKCSGWRMTKGRRCRRTVEKEGDFCEDCKSQSQLGSLNDYINTTEGEE